MRLTEGGVDKLWMTGFLANQLKPNLTKKLHELVSSGDTITITEKTDKKINYVIRLTLTAGM